MEVWFPEADCKNVWPGCCGRLGVSVVVVLGSVDAGSPPAAGNKGDMLTAWPVVCASGLANFGELSRARQALEGDAVAPDDDSTWKLLTDEVRRPRFFPEPLRTEFVDMTPSVAVDLDLDLFTKNLRSARRGVAGLPSGITTEHLKLFLENVVCAELFGETSTRLARGRVPPEIVSGIRLGRMTALQQPDGGVRGIVVGDVFRRLVAR